MAIAIVEELWTRIRAAIDDKIVAATDARDQAVTAKNAAVAAQTAAEDAAAGAGGGIPAEHTHTAADISDATTVGRNVLKAADAAAARTAIGAGTSSLALGTTASTAKAGNYQPAVAEVTGLQSALNAKVTGVGITSIEVVTTMPGTPSPTTFYIVKAS